ncbi:hypothetical protein BZM27_09355 [Paraburkholderia steynii]|uniref:Uncharacterized protein n=1 Tax=Paraburkholderia steynii TaxID=1245441 RepID=A0A4R0XMX3_9BURK|nr:hypothetical protein BZM27_09355 [Paraburkholderia steynii]
MANFEHGAIVAELNAGIDAACEALRAATAVCDSDAVKAANAEISRLVNDLQVAEAMKAAGRADDAARAKDDLQTAIEAALGPSIDAINRALLGVALPFLIGPEEEGLVSAARGAAVARRQYEQARAVGVETAAALSHLDGVIGETEAMHRAAVSAFADGDRSDAARQRMAELAECLANLHAARVVRPRSGQRRRVWRGTPRAVHCGRHSWNDGRRRFSRAWLSSKLRTLRR